MYQTLTTDSQRQKTKNTCGKILGNIGLFLLVFLAAVPVLWLIYLSLKSNTDILTNPLALPDTLHWENYVNAYKTIPFYSMVKNTGIVILSSPYRYRCCCPSLLPLHWGGCASAAGRCRTVCIPTSSAASSCRRA